jgi:hypothetical protein
MANVKTTVSLDEHLMYQVRARAARTGRTQSEVLETALREGLGALDRLRRRANLGEEEALGLADGVVHEIRREQNNDG